MRQDENRTDGWGGPKALPIDAIDWNELTITAADGTILRPYGSDGTWIAQGPLVEGAIRYLGSATHGGHIELKALYVLRRGSWINLISGDIAPLEERAPLYGLKGER